MRRLACRTIPAAALWVVLAVPVRAQSSAPPVTESVGVSLVQVPVTVLDSRGSPVRGLQLSDFRVFDDGQEIHPDSLDVTEFSPGGAGTGATDRPVVPAKASPVALRRFLLLFDLSDVTSAELARARRAAEKFIQEQIGEQDIVCVGSLSERNGATFMKGFTRDRAELEKALGGLRLPAAVAKPTTTISSDENTAGKGGAFSGSEMAWLQRPGRALDAHRMEQLIHAFGALARAFKKVDGRKQVIFFSHGFDLMVDDSAVLSPLESALDELRRSDCVVNTVDIAGLSEGRPAVNSRWGNAGQEVLYTMAAETSGQFEANSNDFSGQLQRVLEATQVVYVLSFPARPQGRPGRYHRLEVRVSRSGVRVFARPGYEEPG